MRKQPITNIQLCELRSLLDKDPLNEDYIEVKREELGKSVRIETEAFRMILDAVEAYFVLYARGELPKEFMISPPR